MNVVFSKDLDLKIAKVVRGSRRDLHFFASSFVKRCAIIDDDEPSITLLRIDKGADAVSTGPVAPGAKFVRKIEFAEGDAVRIDSGPEGLVYDAKKKEIQWDIPKTQARGVSVSVIFHVTNTAGEESFHIEKITIP